LRENINYENILVQWDAMKKACTHQASIMSMNVSIKNNTKHEKDCSPSGDGFKATLQISKIKEKTPVIGKIKIGQFLISYKLVWIFGQRNLLQEKKELRQCHTYIDNGHFLSLTFPTNQLYYKHQPTTNGDNHGDT
jgi:hypothetical protein